MTNPSKDLLATTEGVDEGSAKSTVEGDPSTEELTGVPNPISQALGEGPGDVEAEPAPPVDMESGDSRASRDARGTGQQLEAGEG
ncbi:MAG: hypothetical protein JWN08_2148 [Frankiales bacterium]|nr:hypothetical protein [Frankiales bacterium]